MARRNPIVSAAEERRIANAARKQGQASVDAEIVRGYRDGLSGRSRATRAGVYAIGYSIALREQGRAKMPRRNPRDLSHPGEQDARMVRSALYAIAHDAAELRDELRDDDRLPGWVTYKVYTAQDRLIPARQYLRERIRERSNPSLSKRKARELLDLADRVHDGSVKLQAATLDKLLRVLPLLGPEGIAAASAIMALDLEAEDLLPPTPARAFRAAAHYLAKNPRRRKGTVIQALIFDKDRFTVRTAHKWALSHGFEATAADVQANTIRVRQRDPQTVKIVGTITLRPGVQATVGLPKR